MKAAPRWQSVGPPRGGRRGAMVECPRCGYVSWKGAACAFCGAALEAPAAGGAQASILPAAPAVALDPNRTDWSYPFLFMVWFLGGLIAGLLCFPPLTVAAGSPLRARLERFLAVARPVSALEVSGNGISPESGTGRPAGAQ